MKARESLRVPESPRDYPRLPEITRDYPRVQITRESPRVPEVGAGGGEALLNVSEGDLTEAEVEALAADYSSRGKRFLEEDPWGEGAQAAAGAGVGAAGW